jgi:hypothetical protein
VRRAQSAAGPAIPDSTSGRPQSPWSSSSSSGFGPAWGTARLCPFGPFGPCTMHLHYICYYVLCAIATTSQSSWSEALSRAQWAPTKGPSRLNQRLEATRGGGLGTTGEFGEDRGAGGWPGWVPDPPGHARPGYALESGKRVPCGARCGRVPGCGRGAPPAAGGGAAASQGRARGYLLST